MFLLQCKIRRSTDSVDLLNAIHDSAMYPLCMQKNPNDTYHFYMRAQSFIQMQHPYDNTFNIQPSNQLCTLIYMQYESD